MMSHSHQNGKDHREAILQLVNGEFYAGAERIQVALGRGLRDRGFDVRYICLKEGLFADRVRDMGFDVCTMKMRARFDLHVVPGLTRYIREHGVSLIHTHSVRSNMIGRLAGRRAGIPVVTHVHSSIIEESPDRVKCRLNWLVDRSTAMWVDRFITVSDNLRDEYLRRGVDAERIVTIRNGINVDEFEGLQGENCFRRQLGIEVGAPVAAMIALFRPVKGVEVFLRAIAEIHEVVPDARFLLIGPWESRQYEMEVKRLIDTLDLGERVTMTGFQEDVQSILQEIDVLVLPSPKTEGLPMVILEAMAMERPVVATTVGGIPEVVADRRTGLLVGPGDHRSLSGAIRSLLQDPEMARSMGEAGKQLVIRRFNERIMVERIVDVYGAMLCRNQDTRTERDPLTERNDEKAE